MHRSDYPDHAFLPTLLSKKEIQDPHKVIDDLFSCFHLPNVRELLRETLDTLVTGSFSKNTTRVEKTDMVMLLRKIEKLVEATHLLYEQKKGK